MLENAINIQDLITGAGKITGLAVGYWRSCVLFAANKLEIFTTIGSRSMSAVEVARELTIDARATEKLLDACANLELLTKVDSFYELSDESRIFLDRASDSFLGDWMAHLADMLVKGNWQKLAEHVETGKPVGPTSRSTHLYQFDKKRETLRNWIVGMHQMGVAGHAEVIASTLPLDETHSVLDVGGGPGTYSVGLCRRYPQLKATILDSPDVSGIAEQLVTESGLADRITFVDGDFRSHNMGRLFDTVAAVERVAHV